MNRQILDNLRYTKIVKDFAVQQEEAKPLTFLNRVKEVEVFNELDIIAKITKGTVAANLVLNDAKAVVVQPPKYQVTPRLFEVPNLKIGTRVNQNDLEEYDKRKKMHPEMPEFRDWELSLAEQGVDGIRMLQNVMCLGMMLDSFSYDRFNVSTSSTFGMPNDLKVTLTGADQITMANLSTATPIDTIQALNYHAQITYGITYDHVDMSPELFQILIKTDEFKEKLRFARQLPDNVPVPIAQFDLEGAKAQFTEASGFTVNLESKNVRYEDNDGGITTSRLFPVNKILLSSKNDWNTGDAYDFGVTVPSEAKFSALDDTVPTLPQVPGIVSYYTFEPSYNPPSYVAWSVKKGYPRKNVLESTAVITAS